MGKMNTAERVSREMSDNFVFQRSLLAYHAAAQRIGGDVLEIGTGAGYGIEVVAPHARSFITVDKFAPAAELTRHPHVEFHQAVVPPLAFAANSFDFVISFQVIEHIKQDVELVREVKRVLKPGGKFIVTTPNAPMSLTRNPWHVREYTAEQLQNLLEHEFRSEPSESQATGKSWPTTNRTAAAWHASRASTSWISSTACPAACSSYPTTS